MKTQIKLLYVEDDALDREMFRRMVAERSLPYELTVVETLAQARACLAGTRFDIIVTDYHLPDGQSTELFAEVPEIPFVLVTGTLEEQLALRTLERGADDYLPKDPRQRHLEAVPFTVEKTLRRKRIRDREQQLTRELRESEERFRLLVEGVKDYAILMLDREGRVTTWNTGAEQLKGYTAAEILGQHFSRFYTPEDVARDLPAHALAIAAEQGRYSAEGWRVRKDGRRFWAGVRISAVRDPAGTLQGFAKVTQDLTERRAAEARIAGEKAFSDALIGSLPGVLVVLDAEQRVVRWSQNVRRVTGYSAEQLSRLRALDLVVEKDRSLVWDKIQEAMVSGESATELEIRTQEGEGVPYSFRARRLEFGGAVSLVAVGVDISERKRAEAELRQSEERFHTLADTMSQLAWMADENGWIFWYNQRWYDYTGTTLEQMRGWGWQQVHHPGHVRRVVEKIRHCFQTDEPWEDTFPLRDKGGQYRWFLSRALPIRNEQGKVIRWFGTHTDITEQKHAEAGLRESEAKFRTLFEHTPDAIFLTIPDGRITAANPAACAMFGMSEAELIQAGRAGLIDPEDTRHARMLEERQRLGHCQAELKYLRKNGERFTAEASSVVLGGEPPRSFVILRDITDRKRAEEALRQQERLLRMVLGLLPVGVWIFDAQGRMVQNNPAASLIWSSVRHGPGEAFGEYWGRQAGTGRPIGAPDWVVRRALAQGETALNEEIEVLDVAGRPKTILVSALPIRNREGAITGAVMANEDITERKQHTADLEQTVQERTAKLRELLSELEHMSYSIVHDMRAPLRAIQGFASLIEETEGGRLSAQSQSFLANMRKASNRMDNLITDALNYNQAVREELPLEPVDVAELLGGMLASYPEFQAPRAEICLEGELPPVLGNRSGLTQCFSNLLSNAVKFVRPGVKPQVRVYAQEQRSGPEGPGSVRIWFVDNGVGIPPGGERRIFDMFQRLHGSEYPGTGIGLALVRKVTERMGGRVGVEAAPGEGSRFWVELKTASASVSGPSMIGAEESIQRAA